MYQQITKILFIALFVIGMGMVTEPAARAGIVTSDIEINVPQTTVWQILSSLENVQLFDPGITKAYYLSDVKTGLGATGYCVLEQGYMKKRVTAWDDEHSITIEVYENGMFGLMKQASGTYTLRNREGKTSVTFTVDYAVKGGVFGNILGSMMQGFVRDAIGRNLEGLKQYAEAL